MFRKFTFIFLSFAATLLLVAYVLPDHYHFSKSIETQAESSEVNEYLLNLKNWEAWAPWIIKNDNTYQADFKGVPGQLQQKWEWISQENGNGSAQITQIDTSSNGLNVTIELEKPVKLMSIYAIQYDPTGNGTIINFDVNGELTFPLGRFMGFFLQSALEKEVSLSLEKLKHTIDSTEQLRALKDFKTTIVE